MSAANATKIFGIRLGVDPKILVGVLVVLAGLLFWYNSGTDDSRGGTAANAPQVPAAQPGPGNLNSKRSLPSRRASQAVNDRSILRMRPIDATKGDVDPTLHLGLLSSLGAVEEGKIGRSVFEIGATPETAAAAKMKAPVIPVGPVAPPVSPAPSAPPPVNIPFKYYGYAKPGEVSEANRGLFLDDGENVLVASEGQTIKGHYLIVELTPRQARIEDTAARQSKDVPVTPVAQP